jgi:adenylate kinase
LEGIVGIAGTPGTGKKSVAPLVAARLGLACQGINEAARALGVPVSQDGAVDTDDLKAKLRGAGGPSVVYGHLLPYVFDRDAVSKVIILRCEPSALKERLLRRGYSRQKVVENVEAELIGLEASDAYDAFGPSRTFEVDTTHLTPESCARKIVAVLLGKKKPARRIDWVGTYDSGAKLKFLLSVARS